MVVLFLSLWRTTPNVITGDIARKTFFNCIFFRRVLGDQIVPLSEAGLFSPVEHVGKKVYWPSDRPPGGEIPL